MGEITGTRLAIAMWPMDVLPTEIFDQIVQYLFFSDVRRMMLVCQEFRYKIITNYIPYFHSEVQARLLSPSPRAVYALIRRWPEHTCPARALRPPVLPIARNRRERARLPAHKARPQACSGTLGVLPLAER